MSAEPLRESAQRALIAAHLAEIYGANVSKQTITTITDRVQNGLAEWQARPLDAIAGSVADSVAGLRQVGVVVPVRLRPRGVAVLEHAHAVLGARIRRQRQRRHPVPRPSDQRRRLRLLGPITTSAVAALHRHDRPLHTHCLEHAVGAGRRELRQVKIRDAQEPGQILALAGVADALGDAGRFELSFLPRQLGVAELLVATGLETGTLLLSKKGDFVITLDSQRTGGAELKVVVQQRCREQVPESLKARVADALRALGENT